MKRIILITLLTSLTLLAKSQSKIDSTIKKSDPERLEKPLVKKFINQQFGNLINPQSNNIIGNFASLDLKEAEVNFAGNIIFNNGSILGIKARGAVTDGFLSVFNNNKLNTKLGIDLQYNFLDFKRKSIIYDNATSEKYQALKAKVQQDYELKKIEIEQGQKKILLQIDIQKVTNQITVLNKKLATLKGLSKDSLNIEILKLNQELVFKNTQLKTSPSIGASLNELENWKASEIIKAESEVKLYGFKLGWFSIGYGITNNAFRLFDGALTPDKQISKANYANHTLKLQYSFYNKTPAVYESYFLSLGAAASIQDNFSELSKVEINELKNYGLNPNDRFITSKYNAYQGVYAKDLKSLSFYGDCYWFLFNDNKGAFHFYPEHQIVESLKPTTNLGFGFLLAFKNKEKTDNTINSELYVNLLDVFDTNNSAEKLFNRSNYGIRFTFPINFN